MSTALAMRNSFDWDNQQQLQEIKGLISQTPLTETEFSYLVQLGKATQLNPFNREIWAIKYSSKSAAQIFIGRDGYRIAASRHPMYLRHQVVAVYSKDDFKVVNDEIIHSYGLSERGELESAYCKVYLKGQSNYSYVYVTMKEYGLTQSVWKDKPETMIKKVAEAQALRQSFPDFFAGTYSDAELSQQEAKPTLHIVNGSTQTEKLNNILDEKTIYSETGEVTNKKSKFVPGNPEICVSEEQINEIRSLIEEKELSKERIDKAFSIYKIEKLEQLTDAQAKLFIFQLEKV
jgi:phage recombination protein Bet